MWTLKLSMSCEANKDCWPREQLEQLAQTSTGTQIWETRTSIKVFAVLIQSSASPDFSSSGSGFSFSHPGFSSSTPGFASFSTGSSSCSHSHSWVSWQSNGLSVLLRLISQQSQHCLNGFKAFSFFRISKDQDVVLAVPLSLPESCCTCTATEISNTVQVYPFVP